MKWSEGRPSAGVVRGFLLPPLILLFHPLTAAPFVPSVEGISLSGKIRVLLEREDLPVTLSGTDLVLLSKDEEPLNLSGIDRKVTFRGDGPSLRMEGVGLIGREARIFARGGVVRWKGGEWRGTLVLRRREGSIELINEIDLEDYVTCVASAELPPSFHPEAIKAQAVAVRTYALFRALQNRKKGEDYDLLCTIEDQLYRGWGDERYQVRAGVRATEGLVLITSGTIQEALYHSTCGGWTATPSDIWGRANPTLPSVECGFCTLSPSFSWEFKASETELLKLLGKRWKGLEGSSFSISPERTGPRGRVMSIRIGGADEEIVIRGEDFRRIVGFNRIKSTLFDIWRDGEEFVFIGRGSGHGAGMCQWGAQGMALSGVPYRNILKRFYPFGEVKKIETCRRNPPGAPPDPSTMIGESTGS